MSRLIVIEGIDGSGKGTQAGKLQERLWAQGHSCALISFPRYQATRFGQQIAAFLNGKFGPLDQVHPVLVSLLFAGDRLESAPVLHQALAENDVVVCDRYVPSNLAHQAAKCPPIERDAFRSWVEFVEHQLHQLPQPDRIFWLDISVPTAQRLIARKGQRSYTDRAADLQEADAEYLQRVRDVYADLCEHNPRWRRIPVEDQGQLRAPDEITDALVEGLQDMW